MIDCRDKERQAIVRAIARESSLEAIQEVLENAVRVGDEKLIGEASQVLRSVLGGSVSTVGDRVSVADLMPSYLKTVETVLAKGVPRSVALKECRIEDCPSCFFENICERISVDQLIQKSRALVEGLQGKER